MNTANSTPSPTEPMRCGDGYTTMLSRFLGIGLGALVLSWITDPLPTALAGHLTVSTTADSGPGSLRAAIEKANGEGDSGEPITFAPDLAGGIIKLTSDSLVIKTSLAIEGPPEGVTLLRESAAKDFAVFVIGEDVKPVNISLLTITGGKGTGGGGISNQGTLYLKQVVVTGNSAESGGGILNHGQDAYLEVVESIVSDNVASANGGGIANDRELIVIGSAIRDNRAPYGGGIFQGLLINSNNSRSGIGIDTSTITNNVAEYDGGGMYFSWAAYARRLFLVDQPKDVSNAFQSTSGQISSTTIAFNRAGDGRTGRLAGGISNSAGFSVELDASMLYQNNHANCIGPIVSAGGLLVDFEVTAASGTVVQDDDSPCAPVVTTVHDVQSLPFAHSLPPQSVTAMIACNNEPALRATAGAPTHVTFKNRTSGPVKAYWVNYDGKRVPYETIAAGSDWKQDSAVTHAWVLTDANDRCLSIYLPKETPNEAVIRGALDERTSAMVACNNEPALRATAGAPTHVTFKNRTSGPVKAYWINYDGKRVPYETIAAGSDWKQDSAVTHAWVLTDANDRCLSIYLPKETPSEAVIQ